METTHVSETSTLYNHTPGNYPKEDNIRFSQHGESLKPRTINKISQMLGTTINKISNMLGTAINKISKMLGTTINKISKMLGTTINKISKMLGTTINKISKMLGTTINKIPGNHFVKAFSALPSHS
jgi:DNA anti-recombination protein RmuC